MDSLRLPGTPTGDTLSNVHTRASAFKAICSVIFDYCGTSLASLYCLLCQIPRLSCLGVGCSLSQNRQSHLLTHKYHFTTAKLKLQDKLVQDATFVSEVAHFMNFASAAYGWRGHFAFSPMVAARSATKGILNTSSGNLHSLYILCKIPAEDVITASWESKQGVKKEKIFMPAYYLAIDRSKRAIVFTIRGTMCVHDVLTDVTAEYRFVNY